MNRLRYLRNEKEESLEKIANYLNVTIQTISNYETEKRDMSPETIIKLAEYFGVSTDYLLGKSDHRYSDIRRTNNDSIFRCPVYGKISAGQPNWAEECLEGYLPLDPALMNISTPEECFFLRVNGESMNKEISNGSYALIHKQDDVEDGDIAVILVDGDEATLKKFNRQDDYIYLEPMSTDDTFKVQIYSKSTPIKILGKYIGKFEIKR